MSSRPAAATVPAHEKVKRSGQADPDKLKRVLSDPNKIELDLLIFRRKLKFRPEYLG